MPESMEDLLSDMPFDPMPADLPRRVQARLRDVRAVERRRARAVDLGLVGLFAGGVLVLWPLAAGLGSLAPSWQTEGVLDWGRQVLESPATSIWATVLGGMDWSGKAAQVTGPVGLFGLVLLASPLFIWLRRLMPAGGEGAMT